MLSSDESVFMEEAFRLAEEALLQNEVPVGCVFVFNGHVVISKNLSILKLHR